MKEVLAFGLNILADVFYPKYCFGCKRSGNYLCKFCSAQITIAAESFCIVCNKTSFEGLTHIDCKTELSPDRLISAFAYQNQVVSDMIITGKYYFVSETFALLGKMAAHHIKYQYSQNLFRDFIICPLPLHPSKKRWRGFNQCDIIASAFEYTLNIPALELLKRKKKTQTQKDLDAENRKKNMSNAFAINNDFKNAIPEKVILVDDVCTTGQTLIEATKVLKENGVQTVVCVTLAKD